MKHLLPLLILLFAACSQQGTEVILVGHTPTNDTCFAKGVSGAGLALLGGRIFLIGGANFPEVPVCQGGTKRFYSNIYSAILSHTDTATILDWQHIADLTVPVAYGLTIADSAHIYIIGGSNASGSLSQVQCLTPTPTSVTIDNIATLPFTIDNMAGAIIEDNLYMVGGSVNGKPSDKLYRLSLASRTIEECPAPPTRPRVQPVCVAIGKCLYLWGGYYQATDSLGNIIPDSCMVHTDGWCYNTTSGAWTELPSPTADDGTPITLSGASAVATSQGKVLAMGGVNRDIFLGAIKGLYPNPEYQMHEPEWYKFNQYVMLYDPVTSSWDIVTKSHLTARAGGMLISTQSGALMMGGETMPGIRSTDISAVFLGQ